MHETVAALPSPEWFALLQIAIATYFRILWRLQQHTADMRYAPVYSSCRIYVRAKWAVAEAQNGPQLLQLCLSPHS